jgi:hypothetical protein
MLQPRVTTHASSCAPAAACLLLIAPTFYFLPFELFDVILI